MCKAADLAFMQSLEANRTTADHADNDVSRFLVPVTSNSFFEDPATLYESCLDEDIQVKAVATSSGNWGRPREAFSPSNANNGRFQCNETTCYDSEALPSWFRCPRDDTGGIVSGGENFHYIEAGPGVTTGKWFELAWEEPQCLCQIWIDTKAFLDRYPCGRGTMQHAPNRVLNADIQYWNDDARSWVTVGSKMDAIDDWGFIFPECVSSSKLRLFNVGTGLDTTYQARNPILYELKVYNCDSECDA
ncbi:MAG: hypothetical protein SGILL_009769, partial [Bacillariaceae sp.]